MHKIGDHAVVVGAGGRGLLAARVLADAYERVTVVDRDPLPERAADRRGVPQGRHVHLLLTRGAQILAELFPGILADLAAGGAPVLGHHDLMNHTAAARGHPSKGIRHDHPDRLRSPLSVRRRRMYRDHRRGVRGHPPGGEAPHPDQ